MSIPVKQGQHRLSKTYQKHWAYWLKGKLRVCVWHKGQKILCDEPIDEFSVVNNEFDIPFIEDKDSRHYENMASIIETRYNFILESILKNRCLDPKHEDALRHFASLTLCRSEAAREEFLLLLTDPITRDRFIEEITSLQKISKEDDWKFIVPLLEPEEILPVMSGSLTQHFVDILRTFNAIILTAAGGGEWLSSDHPVTMDWQENYESFLTPDTEIYFPLSPKFCLFFFHRNSTKISNPIRSLPLNQVHEVDEQTWDQINKKILNAAHKSIIIPMRYKEGFKEGLDGMSSNT